MGLKSRVSGSVTSVYLFYAGNPYKYKPIFTINKHIKEFDFTFTLKIGQQLMFLFKPCSIFEGMFVTSSFIPVYQKLDEFMFVCLFAVNDLFVYYLFSSFDFPVFIVYYYYYTFILTVIIRLEASASRFNLLFGSLYLFEMCEKWNNGEKSELRIEYRIKTAAEFNDSVILLCCEIFKTTNKFHPFLESCSIFQAMVSNGL